MPVILKKSTKVWAVIPDMFCTVLGQLNTSDVK